MKFLLYCTIFTSLSHIFVFAGNATEITKAIEEVIKNVTHEVALYIKFEKNMETNIEDRLENQTNLNVEYSRKIFNDFGMLVKNMKNSKNNSRSFSTCSQNMFNNFTWLALTFPDLYEIQCIEKNLSNFYVLEYSQSCGDNFEMSLSRKIVTTLRSSLGECEKLEHSDIEDCLSRQKEKAEVLKEFSNQAIKQRKKRSLNHLDIYDQKFSACFNQMKLEGNKKFTEFSEIMNKCIVAFENLSSLSSAPQRKT